MNLSLTGKYALICGSTQGIGLAIASELATLGATCTLLARNEETLRKAVQSLDASAGQMHNYLVADFTQPEQLKTVIAAHTQLWPVNILVNNTGGGLALNRGTIDWTVRHTNPSVQQTQIIIDFSDGRNG